MSLTAFKCSYRLAERKSDYCNLPEFTATGCWSYITIKEFSLLPWNSNFRCFIRDVLFFSTFTGGDCGLRYWVLDNWSCGISVILISKCGIVVFSKPAGFVFFFFFFFFSFFCFWGVGGGLFFFFFFFTLFGRYQRLFSKSSNVFRAFSSFPSEKGKLFLVNY